MTCRIPDVWRRRAGLAATLCIAVLAAACSSKDKGGDVAEGPACPGVGVLADAAKLVRFQGTEASMSEVVFRAEMVNAAATCDYDDDHVDLALAIQVQAVRGEAEGPSTYPSRYFVAVVDSNERILARELFDLPIEFGEGKQQAVLRDQVDRVRIPVKNKEAGAAYQVLVGFELTADQVIYNRVTSGLVQGGI